MKRYTYLFITLLFPVFQLAGQNVYDDIQGAWETVYTAPDGVEARIVAIVMDGFIAETEYARADGSFRWTLAGSWEIEGNEFLLHFEAHSADTNVIGTTGKLQFNLQGDVITFTGDERKWTRIDDRAGSPLAGPWLITGRMRDGEISRRTPGPRKTMKILSGTRFQWIAYNTDTKEFRGTGGGTYSATNGVYTEHIEFFSRDDKRVGATLPFEFEVKDNDWHHSGKSSKGEPIHEVWSKRKGS